LVLKRIQPDTYRAARLVEELSYIVGNDDPSLRVYVDRERLGQWRVLLQLPTGCRYEGLWFELFVEFPELYPGNAPLLTFVGPPYHVNISEHGRFVLPEIQEYYDDSLHVFEILEEVKLMLMKRRQRQERWAGDDDDERHMAAVGGIDPRVDPHPVDDEHAKAYANPAEYKRRVEEYNRKNGRHKAEDFVSEWDIEVLPAEEARQIKGLMAIPRQYRCSISGAVMENPVFSPTTKLWYEKATLAHRLGENSNYRCPVTGLEFPPREAQLVVDPEMTTRIIQFRRDNG
jgi:ubiquitin-protein ligase